MKIGLYGLPGTGKSHILNKIDFINVVEGSSTMKKIFPDFDILDEIGKNIVRKQFAENLLQNDDFIMDGHYSFGDKIAFTEADGSLYDVFLYLYINPVILLKRMNESDKNSKYAKYDIEKWQKNEIYMLREYCHEHDKDFYVIDCPENGCFEDVEDILAFIKDICRGYSCVGFARTCAEQIIRNELGNKNIILADGDKTVTVMDTSNLIYGYTTKIFDNNFYTGYQAWRHFNNFQRNYLVKEVALLRDKIPFLKLNEIVTSKLGKNSYILTSGEESVWKIISSNLKTTYFGGRQMSADTKFFITKYLKKAGKYIVAYGDGMNDYYMLKEADEAFLISKPDGSISRSIKNMNLGGIQIV